MEKGVSNWAPGVWIGGVLINGKVCEYLAIQINGKIPAWLKVVLSRYRLIRFFELLCTGVGIRLWAPLRSCTKDLIWIGIPIFADNQGADYIPEKNYTSYRPTSWILHGLSVHNLDNNFPAMSRHWRGVSGIWPLISGTTTRGPPVELGETKKREIPPDEMIPGTLGLVGNRRQGSMRS